MSKNETKSKFVKFYKLTRLSSAIESIINFKSRLDLKCGDKGAIMVLFSVLLRVQKRFGSVYFPGNTCYQTENCSFVTVFRLP